MSSLRTPARPRIALPTDLNATVRRVRPEWIFAVFAVVATVWLMYEGRHFTFQGDEWDWILHRRGLSPAVFLTPHVDHLSALPIAVYKLLLAAFGDRSTFPFRLVDAVLAALTASLTFVFVARRLGGWIALAPATVLLVLGPGWDDLLWGFQMGYLFSLVAGLGALLALERRDRRGDVAACVLLIIGIAASSVGIMVLVGALVLVLFSVRSRGWRRLWVVGVPAALYAIWYSQYGVSSVRFSNIHLVPLYSFDALGAVLGSLTGLTSPDNTPYLATLSPGTSLAAILVVGFGLRFLLGGPLSRRFWSVTAVAVAFWFAAALDYASFREANASRYIYAVAPFVIVAIAECFRGSRLPRIRGMALLYVAAAAAVVSNLSFLNQGADVFDVTSEFARGELAALQVSRGIVSPTFHPESPAITSIIGAHNMIPIDAGSYFAAVNKFGSPADTVPQLLRAPEEVREASDLVLAKAERITVTSAGATNGAVCQRTVTRGGSVTLSSGPGTLLFAAAGARPSQIALRRFAAANHYVVFNTLPASRALALTLPRDGSNAPWHVQVFTTVPISVCRR